MSFQDQENNTSEQPADQLTFTVGDRTFDANSAATKISAADEHIAKIEAENARVREQLAALETKVEQSVKVEDALNQLHSKEETKTTPDTKGVSEDEIGAIATKQIEEYLAAKQVQEAQAAAQALAEQTFKETSEALVAQFGEKTDEVMKSKASELGVSFEQLVEMAKQPATAKLLLQNIAPQSKRQATPSGSFNTASLNGQAAPAQSIDWSKGGSNHIFEALQASR